MKSKAVHPAVMRAPVADVVTELEEALVDYRMLYLLLEAELFNRPMLVDRSRTGIAASFDRGYYTEALVGGRPFQEEGTARRVSDAGHEERHGEERPHHDLGADQ